MGMEKMLNTLANAPASQIDASVVPRIRAIQHVDVNSRPKEMLKILDECVHSSLASEFAMVAMDLLWKEMIKDALTSSLNSSDERIRRTAEFLKGQEG